MDGGGPYVFRLQGELCHEHGSLLPDPNSNKPPSYCQLYIVDPAQALLTRQQRNAQLSGATMSNLQDMMLQYNPFAPLYRNTAERLRMQAREPSVNAWLTYKPHTDPRRYNLPTGADISVVLPGDGDSGNSRDIVLQLKGGGC